MAVAPAHARLGVVGKDAQHALAAVAADVQPGDDAVAQQERQHVVAVAPLRRRLVDLDQVLEAEHAGRERPVPQQVVEGRQQHGGRGRPGRLRAGRDQHGWAAVGHLQPLQHPVRHERVDVRPDPGGTAAQAVVLDHAVFGQHAAGAHGPRHERAQELVLAGRRRAQDLVRDHPLGQVVQALEAGAAGYDQVARRPQRVQHPPGRLPAPHAAAARSLEVPGAERAAFADLRQHAVGQLRVAVDHRPEPVVRTSLVHTPPPHRPVADRHQAGLVRPVLEHAALPEQLRDGAAGIAADAAGQGDPVAALDRRDRVQLHAAQPVDCLRHLDRPASAGA